MAESMLKEVETTRKVIRGQPGPINDLMALLERSARLLQLMAYQLEGRWHSQHIGPTKYHEPGFQKDPKGESVQLVVKNVAGSGIALGYTRALEQLASVNQSRLLNVEEDRLCYRVWTESRARFAREVMSMPGYRPLRIQAAPSEITAFLEPEPEATFETPDEAPNNLNVSVAASPIRQKPRNGTMEAGIDAFFNSRHYLTTEGQPGPIEMRSWRVEISLEGGQFDQNGKLSDLYETQTAVKQLLAGYNNRLLNNLKPYDQVQPTPENIARILYEQIKAAIVSQPLRLKGLKVWANPTQYVWYSEQSRDAA